jgi:ElaB/YqjD/DUF883 family membrane-anchored ribosome-binding protein
MTEQKPTHDHDLNQLMQDTRALLAASADVAGDHLVNVRKRLAVALDEGREIFAEAKDCAVKKAKAADVVVREHPYQAALIALGIGALLGYLVARRRAGTED